MKYKRKHPNSFTVRLTAGEIELGSLHRRRGELLVLKNKPVCLEKRLVGQNGGVDIIAQLRIRTAADHQSAEGSIPLMIPDLTNGMYVRVLCRMHGIVSAWEQHAIRTAPDWLRKLLEVRERRQLLEDDIRHFATEVPSGEGPAIPNWNAVELAGATYVMEGSRLGGLLIARHAEHTLGLHPGQGDAYFRSAGLQVKPRWTELLDAIRSHVPAEEGEEAIRAAKEMFQLFGRWMRC